MKRQLLFAFALLAAVIPASANNGGPSSIAQCLAKSGATMYSAWWCPSCFAQLEKMGPSLARGDMKNTEQLLREFPFVKECAEPKTGNFTMGCPSDLKGIPTWEFSDGSRLIGTQDLDVLAQKTGCPLPTPANQKK